MWAIFQTIRRSWARHFVAQFSGLVIMSLTYSAALLVVLSLVYLAKTFDRWGQINAMTIYLKPKTAVESRKTLEKYLSSKDLILESHFFNSQHSAKKFSDTFSYLSKKKINSKNIGEYFPETYQIHLNQNLAYKSGHKILDNFVKDVSSQFKFISHVSYGKNWLERYSLILHFVKIIGLSLVGLFLLGSMVISSNVIKTILHGKKDEIEILEFIGADDRWILLPQILNILIITSLSLFFAIGLNLGLFYTLKEYPGLSFGSDIFLSLSFIDLSTILFTLFIGLLLQTLYSSWIAYNMLPRQQRNRDTSSQGAT